VLLTRETKTIARLGAHRKFIETIFLLPVLTGGSYSELCRVRQFVCVTTSAVDELTHVSEATGEWEQSTVCYSAPRIMNSRFTRFGNPSDDQ
jgi:hypothetical protein